MKWCQMSDDKTEEHTIAKIEEIKAIDTIEESSTSKSIDVNNELKASIDSLRKSTDIMHVNTNEVSLLIKEFEKLSYQSDKAFKSDSELFKTSISDLHKELLVIRRLPEKMEERLNLIAPEIAQSIQKLHNDLLEQFNQNIQTCNENLYRLSDNCTKSIEANASVAGDALNELIAKSAILTDHGTKARITNIAITTTISIMMSLIVSYVIVKQITHRVQIHESSGAIHIEQSTVSVWGKDFKLKEQLKVK